VDLSLPDADGCEAPIALKGAAPELPLVVFSGRAFDAVALDLMQYGLQNLLPKGGTSITRVLQLAAARQAREAGLRRQACEDPLTGALNRHGLQCRAHGR
jgi:DNA-binding NarL/FixJ family response regulator